MFWIIYYASTALFLFYVFLDITWRLWKRKIPFLPCAPNVPWLGVVPYFQKDSPALYKQRIRWFTKYNHLFISWFLTTPVISIGCIEYLEPLLKSQEAITKSLIYIIIQEWLGEGLLISTGAKWKKRRVALTGAFHFSILNDFIDIYEKHAKNLVNKLKSLSSDGKEIEVQWLLSLVMLDVICETSMGVNVDALNSSDCEYARAVHEIKILLIKRLTNPLLRRKKIYKHTKNGKRFYEYINMLHNFTINVINENIASRKHSQSNENKSDDNENIPYRTKKKVFIDVLLDLYDKGEIDVEGIREEVDTFMFEGHDTTSSGFSWMLYEVGRHPEIQQKMQEEMDEISGKDCPLVDKIRMLKYTECVIKESLRLHPPVAVFGRKLEKDMVIDNNVIPSGTIMTVDVVSVHLNPAYWDEPMVFNPGRFEGDVKRNPYCYIPFSAGPRNCIGQKFAMLEEKIFMYYVLSNFNIKSMQSPDELEIALDVINHSQNGINIVFTNRN